MRTRENRRDFYRVQDTVAMVCEVLPPGTDLSDPAGLEGLIPPAFRVLNDLQRIEMESRHLLHVIAEEHRNVAEYLRLIDARIDLLTQAIVQSNGDLENMPRCVVKISEGGMEFVHGTPISEGQALLLRMLLLPARTGLLLFGRVIHCDALPESGSHMVGVEFVHLSDGERQQLARHALHLQSEQRREQTAGVPTT